MSDGKFQAPRGTHDVLPGDHLWWHVVHTIEQQTAAYGWRRIQTPGFEDTGLFARTAGEASDVVNKEMYTFEDRSERSLTLRPEGTAPIARAYVEHGLHREPQPVKAYTIAPMYRYGRPGRGRYREHWQLSLEAMGVPGPDIDAEVIEFYVELLRRLGVAEWTLHLNSIGDADCRPAYVERLNAWLDEHDDVLDADARHKRATSPLQVFDVKNPELRAALDDAPKIADSLCTACQEHFDGLRARLDALGVALRGRPDPRPRPRLLHAHRVRVRRARGERQLDDLRRGPLRRPRPGDRRPTDARRGLRRRHRAAPDRDRAENAAPAEPKLDVYFAVEQGSLGRALARAGPGAGFSADTDFASRSIKGQLTQGRSSPGTSSSWARTAPQRCAPPGNPTARSTPRGLLRELQP